MSADSRVDLLAVTIDPENPWLGLFSYSEETRAYFRGRCLEKYADSVAAASWDSVIFDLPGRESLQRVPTIDPLRGSKAHVAALIDRCDTAEELFRALTR